MKLCKKCGIRWAIMARDATHTWYHRGTAAEENFDSTLVALQAEIELVQPREVVMLGASMGGYAAIRAGLYLKASAVIAFSPQVLLSTADRSAPTRQALALWPLSSCCCHHGGCCCCVCHCGRRRRLCSHHRSRCLRHGSSSSPPRPF